jgi:hypothetical protein
MALMGASVAPAALLAIAAVIAPVRVTVRVPATIVLTVLLAYAMALGVFRNAPDAIDQSAILPFLYFVFLVPTVIVARLRRWRVVRDSPPSSAPREQYSLLGLFTVITTAGLTLAAGRWVLFVGEWPDAPAEWSGLALRTGVASLIVGAGCLPALACTAFLLTPGRRWRLFAAWCLGAVVGLTLLYVAMERMEPGSGTLENFAVLASVFAGAHTSVFLSLLVVRFCGFRLLRVTQAGNPVQAGAEAA